MADETQVTSTADEASAPTTPEPSAPAAESSAAPAAPADLDAAIARAAAAMEATSAAQESDDDATDEAAEAPAHAEADAPAADAAPESDEASAADGAEGDDDTPTITRRNAREIAQKAVEQYAAEKQRADDLQRQIQAREAEDSQIVGQVLGWVGTNDEYNQTKARAIDLNLDQYERDEAARELNGMDAARNMYAATWRAIATDHSTRLSQAYLSSQNLPNVNAQAIQTVFNQAAANGGDLPAAVTAVNQHLHEAGRLTERAEWQAKEQKWQAEQAKLKASYEAKLAKAASRMPSPERGGRSAGPSGALEGLLDPRTGFPSDEAEAQWNRGELDRLFNSAA